jgi:hypothetical protein
MNYKTILRALKIKMINKWSMWRPKEEQIKHHGQDGHRRREARSK